jgi:hypothetical protein
MTVPECNLYTATFENGSTHTVNLYLQNNPCQLLDMEGEKWKIYQFCFLCGKQRFNPFEWYHLQLNTAMPLHVCEECDLASLDNLRNSMLTTYAIKNIITNQKSL